MCLLTSVLVGVRIDPFESKWTNKRSAFSAESLRDSRWLLQEGYMIWWRRENKRVVHCRYDDDEECTYTNIGWRKAMIDTQTKIVEIENILAQT